MSNELRKKGLFVSPGGVRTIWLRHDLNTYTGVVQVKLYLQKHAITAADLLNDRVIPFFEEQGIPLLRI